MRSGHKFVGHGVPNLGVVLVTRRAFRQRRHEWLYGTVRIDVGIDQSASPFVAAVEDSEIMINR